ncbi:hypothetical protein AB1Y20_007202 [Prymnesium parvum]|uniref:Uncharacterized protein n=1 Tax=Prymnesium parvum TaxID=97485 RepID=A0AB34IWE1_PRYPA
MSTSQSPFDPVVEGWLTSLPLSADEGSDVTAITSASEDEEGADGAVGGRADGDGDPPSQRPLLIACRGAEAPPLSPRMRTIYSMLSLEPSFGVRSVADASVMPEDELVDT